MHENHQINQVLSWVIRFEMENKNHKNVPYPSYPDIPLVPQIKRMERLHFFARIFKLHRDCQPMQRRFTHEDCQETGGG